MTRSRSLGARALMAVVLMVGFYALAIAISVALLWIPYGEATYLGRIHPKLALACILGAGGVLWAIVPRPDRFEPPGPQLTRASAPTLFNLIDQVAKATAQEPPAEVYLLNQVNAFVTQRGGVMGVGSRRVMGVGLPLLAHLTPEELAAVIAHEFGHYVSGDVGLGPWIYKTRSAIGRSIAATDDTWLSAPFRAYGSLFLKTTLAVSREQEFVADRTAARVAGPRAAAAALGRVAALAPAYAMYLESEVKPLLQSGFLPPIAAGFNQYLQQPRIAALTPNPSETPDSRDAGAYDTHPPMADRVAALERLRPEPASIAVSSGPALGQLDQHARVLMRYVLGEELMGKLRSVAWDEVGETVYARRWRDFAKEYAAWLGTRTVGALPVGHQAFARAGATLIGKREQGVSADEGAWRAVHVFVAGVGAALLRDGWKIETAPGQPLMLVKEDRRFEPGAAIGRLANDEETEDGWRETCQTLRIGHLSLGGESERAVAATA